MTHDRLEAKGFEGLVDVLLCAKLVVEGHDHLAALVDHVRLKRWERAEQEEKTVVCQAPQ